jgi:4-carboxymuconolactone decarboxylase
VIARGRATRRASARHGGDRLPPIPAARLTQAQRRAARELARGRRGGVIGPFIPALRSPAFMSRLQRLGEYLRYDNVLGPRLTELAILLTARAWTQAFEWAYHVASAEERGIPRRVIEAIAAGHRPARMARKDAVVYDFVTTLERRKSVGDAIYARAVAALGEAGVVDLIGVVGYYSLLAMILNVARTPLPPDYIAELEPLAADRRPRRARSAARRAR